MSPERAADVLFRQFADMIARGELKDGEPLPPERVIVETYGVSRTVAREAVQALANRGLVEARPRFRPIVRRPSYDTAVSAMDSVVSQLLTAPDGVRNLFDTRILVEAGLVRQAANNAKKEDIVALKSALAENFAAIEDSEAFYLTDCAFHKVLYAMSGNPVLLSVHKAYVDWLAPQWRQMPRQTERNSANYTAHAAIYDAILMRDPDAAEDRLRAHLELAWRQVSDTFFGN